MGRWHAVSDRPTAHAPARTVYRVGHDLGFTAECYDMVRIVI